MARDLVGLYDYQVEFALADDPVVALLSGAGLGKTVALAAKILVAAFSRPPEETGIIGGPTRGALKLSIVRAMQAWYPRWGFTVKVIWGDAPWCVITDLETGEQRGADLVSMHKPDTARGPNPSWFAGDELREIDREAFNVMVGRVRTGASPQIFWSSTPNGFDWQWDVMVGEPADDATITGRRLMSGLPAWRNPELGEQYFTNLAQIYDPQFFLQEVCGQFVRMGQGRVYPYFDRAIHVKPTPFQPQYPLLLSSDFNKQHAGMLLVQRPELEARVVGEVVLANSYTGVVAEEFCDRYARKDAWHGHRPHLVITGDASGGPGKSNSSRGDYDVQVDVIRERFNAEFGREGSAWDWERGWRRSNPAESLRVGIVNSFCRNHAGASFLSVDPSCSRLAEDMEKTVFDERGKIDKRTNDEALRRRTHPSDALGYALHWLRPAFGDREAVGSMDTDVFLRSA